MKAYLVSKEADSEYSLGCSYDFVGDAVNVIYDELITDGDSMEIAQEDYHEVFFDEEGIPCESVEIFKVVSISNASFVIIQKIKNLQIKHVDMFTLIEDQSTIDLLGKISMLDNSEDIDVHRDKPCVVRVRI